MARKLESHVIPIATSIVVRKQAKYVAEMEGFHFVLSGLNLALSVFEFGHSSQTFQTF